MTVSKPIPITGCRHDAFGHALKAFGILRALNVCAADEHLDSAAEAWWDVHTGVFYLQSRKYPSEADLTRFFEQHYRPTLIFSPWNTLGGLDDKQEVVLTFAEPISNKKGIEKPAKPTEKDLTGLIRFLFENRKALNAAGLDVKKRIRDARKKPPKKGEISFVLEDSGAINKVKLTAGIFLRTRRKMSGEEAVIARMEAILQRDAVQDALRLAREFFLEFQAAKGHEERRELFDRYRDHLDERAAAALDAVFAPHTIRASENPAFLRRGMAGRAEIFRSFWSYFLDFRNGPRPQIESALRGGATGGYERTKAPGAPFFPDQIKTYNNGLEWVVETFPFCAMDYILAVEGALALRGSAARLLGARHGNFAAFPFVFETADELTDDTGEAKGTAMSLWLPIWSRPAAFAELQSFILDSQARLPGREARFTAEFARAIRSQGVDAGFAGYQEFRFKMKGARVPWVCTGRYLATDAKAVLADAAELLRPLDEAGFLDQLRVHEKDGRAHRRLLSRILEAVEDAVSEGEPHRYLAILECLFEPTRLLATSKRFREAVRQPVQSPPLPQQPWLEALRELEAEPEFEIARAVASIVGHARRSDGRLSDAEAFLGSILPLKLAGNRRYLPDPLSPQAVWSGSDLCLDLARVLARRYHDSRTDDVPALNSAYPARLVTVLRFLHSELDDTRIARYIEALSLINWSAHREASRPRNSQRDSDIEEPTRPIPLAYAAIRSLLETELGQRAGDAESRRCVSVRTLALLRERSRSGVAAATVEALQRLSIYGVPNPYGVAAQVEKPNLVGRDIVRIAGRALVVAEPLAARLAAAVCVPLRWHDRFALFRAVTLPQIKELKENI